MGKTCLNLSVMKISIFFQSYQDFNQFLKEISQRLERQYFFQKCDDLNLSTCIQEDFIVH